MANYSRWEDVKQRRPAISNSARRGRAGPCTRSAGLRPSPYCCRAEPSTTRARMKTTQSVISRLEEGGGAKNRIDTLARLATALGRHLVLSFPEEPSARTADSVQVA